MCGSELGGISTENRRPPFAPKVWRVRWWIRILCVGQSLGWIVLFGALGSDGGDSVLPWAALAAFVILIPMLALWPKIELMADGTLIIRGWIYSRHANVEQISGLALTAYGLRFSFADDSHFTSIIFQATQAARRPRVMEFVDAVVYAAGEESPYDPWRVQANGELPLFIKKAADE